jgi:glucose/arabinose dehydrogenase
MDSILLTMKTLFSKILIAACPFVLTSLPLAVAQTPAPQKISLQAKAVASGFVSPTDITTYDGTTYVALQRGHIVNLDEDKASSGSILVDLESEVLSDTNRGLLGFAFDPSYAESGRIFIRYTANAGGVESRLSTIKMPPDGSVGRAEHERRLIRSLEPTPRHLAGHIAFGPDGKLYLGMGDGGETNDPRDRAQRVTDIFGSILRIDPTPFGGKPYTSPEDNPASVAKNWNTDVWAVGLRNPSSLSFDPKSGALYVADTGRGDRQEINLIVKGGNYGWSVFDGDLCRRMKFDCMDQRYKEPLVSYGKDKVSDLILGPVYQGKAIPSLVGTLLFADRPSGKIFGLKIQDGKAMGDELLLSTGKEISTFGLDKNGEVLFADYKAGEIFRIVAQ